MRIELTTSAWKAEVLPLNYTRIKVFCQYRFDVSNITCIFFFRQGNVKKFVEKNSFFVRMLSQVYILLRISYNIKKKKT